MKQRRTRSDAVGVGFDRDGIRIKIADLRLLHPVAGSVKKSRKYSQIASSVREVGIIEPPVVARCKDNPGAYLLLDGHLRVEVLKDMAQTEVACLVSTDD